MAEPLLRVSDLSKRFDSLLALSDISFSLQPGEVLGVVGRHGAGKTTLLQIISGNETPSSGSMVFDGREGFFASPAEARKHGIELVHQIPLLTEQLDIVHNIYLGREICWPPVVGFPAWGKMYSEAKKMLADFDMSPSMLQVRTGNLSDEQRQVVAIARALCFPPKLLLLDDSLATLSFHRQQILLEHIKKLADQGVGIIISSDNLKHLFSVTHRILILYESRLSADRLTAECTPRDIVELIVGNADPEQVTPIIWALESYHTAQQKTSELQKIQTALHKSLKASDSLNRQLVERLSAQVKALDKLNAALQETQRRLLTESEEERKAIARELHDQVIQDLLSFNYRLEEAESNEISAEQRQELAEIRNSIREVISDLRQMCRDLRPPTIDNLGLSSAIRSLAQEWAERNGVTLQLEIDPAMGRLPEAIELSVFRIVQEGLNNIRKHAAAQNVHLLVERTPTESIHLRIKDDGQGMTSTADLAKLTANKHFGLVGISERAALLGGTMQITSPEKGGTMLDIEIPSPFPSA